MSAGSHATWNVLGAGSILPRLGYGCAGYALRTAPGEPVTLFDCGPGSLRMLAAVDVRLAEVERVVLSHFHVDHCLDLFAFAFARRNPHAQPARRLEVVGPVGTAELLERGAGTLGEWARDPDLAVTEVELGRCEGLERGALRLSWAPARHTPEALSWRVDLEGGPSLAYSGDTGECDELARLAHAVDLFVCECSHGDERAVAGHLTPAAAGGLARRAGARRLLLTHFYPDLDPALAGRRAAEVFGGPVELARDGSRHALLGEGAQPEPLGGR
jgi:ribonuclease BN (tRNA processing enzyme)